MDLGVLRGVLFGAVAGFAILVGANEFLVPVKMTPVAPVQAPSTPEPTTPPVMPESEPTPAPVKEAETEAPMLEPEAPAPLEEAPLVELDVIEPEVEERIIEGTPSAPTDVETGTLGEKVGSFTERDDSRVSTRLPSISNAAPANAPEHVVTSNKVSALSAHSVRFTDAPRGPVMSLILVDIAELNPRDKTISNLPFPVTFAVDALSEKAEGRVGAYRRQGLEVLAMIGLPEGASPQDAAVTLDRVAEIVPNTIGFLDVLTASFQSSRQVAAQVIATAQSTGRAVVTFPHGLNSLEQEATRANAPAALVLRDIDGEGQDVATIKRFIENAALQAGSGKTVVLLGRSKPETIQALAEWSLGNRAASVTIVPLSYLLTRNAK
ncbi:divergent polysaccharide deacetylase family protein [Celeribacter litoreus]|uniref:divergent polysaccharide deacetylase family protein n=1 Tax=Celeribacter litoreus TaxID=2876714 RepID=UPI001CCEF4BE|nr:divergent polysaccharide deacetylase family protein [Celeribacter litoreus]MCA0044599.1 divergent polysaccharide deacetylase family protein [Celeribacter litoreus]